MNNPLYPLGPATHTNCSICADALTNRSTLVALCAECRHIIANGGDPRDGLPGDKENATCNQIDGGSSPVRRR